MSTDRPMSSFFDELTMAGNPVVRGWSGINGTMINYLVVCERKLWLFLHRLGREQDSELVRIGNLIHQSSFSRAEKEQLIFGQIRLDHTAMGELVLVHEVKKSGAYLRAARLQLLFYMSYLEALGVRCSGVIHIYSNRRTQEVALDDDGRREVREAVGRIREMMQARTPPPVPENAPCRHCAYRDYCRV